MSTDVEPLRPPGAVEWHGDARAPYDRLDDETVEDFTIFALYRDMGVRRSVKRAAEKAEVAVYRVSELSRRHAWRSRADAFDDAMDRQARRELAAEIISERKKTAAIIRVARQKVVDRVMEIDPSELSPRDVAVWLEVLTKLSRQAHGDTEVTKVEVTGKDGGPITMAQEMTAEDRNELLRRITDQLNSRAPLELEDPNVIEGEVVGDPAPE